MSLLSAKQDEEVMAEINITPFTDVLLVLLIIFMILAALVAPPGFEKELPNKNSNSQNNQPKNKNDIEVDVNNKGVIFVDGTKTDETGHLSRDVATRRRRSRTTTWRSSPMPKLRTGSSFGFWMPRRSPVWKTSASSRRKRWIKTEGLKQGGRFDRRRRR